MRPEASLVLEQVFQERLLVASGFQVGRRRTSQVRVSKAWCDTIVAMAMEVNAVR